MRKIQNTLFRVAQYFKLYVLLYMTLAECHVGFVGELVRVNSSEIEMYFLDFGIDTGSEIEIIGKAPLGCPVILQTGNLQFSLRKHELQFIQVKHLHVAIQ